jgi:hypothetical protein
MFTGCGLGKVETHSMRYAYRLWLDAVAVPFAAQLKSIRCAVLCPTMNVYGDIATDEMSVASAESRKFETQRQTEPQVRY